MTSSFRRSFFSSGVKDAAALPSHLLDALNERGATISEDANHDLVVALASELLIENRSILPDWVGVDSKYLVLMDIPEPAALRLPSLLGIRKPDQRMHITRDPGAVKRAIIALGRNHSWETLLDAYVLGDCLVAVCGDLSIREFPQKRLPAVKQLPLSKFGNFELDPSGSFLYWPEVDVHLGPSQMLQAVDPMYLADVEIQRYAMSKISKALLQMREERGLTQGDISGLSERQVRRLENEESRFTSDAAQKYAEVFGLTITAFLEELSRRLGELKEILSDAPDDFNHLDDSQHAYVG